MKRIELLAPAKDYEAAVAAVDYGADALYIGGSRFGARQGATNSVEEIARVVAYAHRFGVKVYATMNTLVWDSELEAAEKEARALLAAGVDALIVQDMAYCRMRLGCELHASTQVQVRTPEVARFLSEAGFARVILERALTLDEIREICHTTSAEVECFVHGAICVGYSGRCFLSRSMSSRSGNLGACSQPCRLKWNLTDGKGRIYLKDKHLLSVIDLSLKNRLGELLDAGGTSFKIEGRLKDSSYIKNVVAAYRAALDAELRKRPHLKRASVGESVTSFRPDTAKSFTRGESEYFLDGKRRGVASFDTPKAVGEYVGRVVSSDRRGWRIETDKPLAAGDGVCLMTAEGLYGTNLNAVEGNLLVANRPIAVAPGTPIYRNYDHLFHKELAADRTRRVIPTRARVTLSADEIVLRLCDAEGVEVELKQQQVLDVAQNEAKNRENIRRQVMRSGETIFRVDEVEIAGENRFVPASMMADMRREGLEKLLEKRLQHPAQPRTPKEGDVRYPFSTLSAEENVTNHLSEQFYRDHGVERIVEPLELAPTTVGARVMQSAYCLRRELGECLKNNPRLKGDLYLETGGHKYRLEFDCKRCEMNLIDCSK